MGEEKKYPFEIKEYYTPSPYSLKRLYTRHPKFTGNTLMIYELLFDYWNAEEGYAFPPMEKLAIISGLSKSGVKKQINILVELDLITKKPSPLGIRLNNIYFLKAPITTEAEFYAKFPEVQAIFEERKRAIEKEGKADKQRLSRSRKKAAAENDEPEENIEYVNDSIKPLEAEELPDDFKDLAGWL